MVDDDLLLDEQIKKRKRLVLLGLLILLLATTLAALPWLQETPSPATAVAEKGSPPPTSPSTQEVTPVLKTTIPTGTATPTIPTAATTSRKTPTATKTPTDVQANEWPQASISPGSDSSQPVPIEATRKSPRWDGPEMPDPIIRPTPTEGENMAVVPPDDLPVTGINLPRKANWIALGIMVLLLSAGVAALLRSEVEQK